LEHGEGGKKILVCYLKGTGSFPTAGFDTSNAKPTDFATSVNLVASYYLQVARYNLKISHRLQRL
jgi:hypothetical protein